MEIKMYNRMEVPEYCLRCGRKLKTKKFFLQYSQKTGIREYGTKLFCTHMFATLLEHPTFEFDENNEEIISRDYF